MPPGGGGVRQGRPERGLDRLLELSPDVPVDLRDDLRVELPARPDQRLALQRRVDLTLRPVVLRIEVVVADDPLGQGIVLERHFPPAPSWFPGFLMKRAFATWDDITVPGGRGR